MSDRATVMIVDDDEIMRLLLEKTLRESYHVVSVASGEACLAACAEQRPDIILLDVEMPDLDGYETCRRIGAADSATPPVVFISCRDRLQDRLQGYDAGGEDYILKPVEPEELLTKVALRLKAVEDRAQLKQLADYAGSTAMTAISSMGEMGVLLQALQRFNGCSTLEDLAHAVLQALVDYDLKGMVRLRTPQGVVMQGTQGAVSPIEMSIVEQVAAMGRITEFHSRMSVSYEHVALLVSNTPLNNEGRRGRLRDHLAVLAEGAEVRTMAIHRDQVIERVALQGSRALDRIDEGQRQAGIVATLALQDMSDQLDRAYISAALSENQENFISGIIRDGIEKIRQAILPETDLQQQLTSVITELKTVTRH